MKINIQNILVSSATALLLLCAPFQASAQNTVQLDGLCVADGIILTENGTLNGKVWYIGTGTVLGFNGVAVDLYWDDIDATWYLAFDGQPYFANSDNSTLPPPTYGPGWVATVDNLDCNAGDPLEIIGTGTEGGGDTDGDNTPDAIDGCPNDANKTAPGACGCGVADADADGDGTADCLDGCPNDANKTAPGACGCGVADADADNNGTVDCLENADADNDGVPNETDNCPMVTNSDQEDSDCDGVGNVCDVCPGGDDSVDNNQDGLPDCKYPPAYADITETWKCGNGNNQKVLVCHNGHHTNCISYAALAAHISHGDYLGACDNSACAAERSTNVSTAGLSPNPASGEARLQLSGREGESVRLSLTDMSGALLQNFSRVVVGEEPLRLDLSGMAAGIYLLRVNTADGAVQVLKLVVETSGNR